MSQEELKLKKVFLYRLDVAKDELQSETKGYYRDKSIATIDSYQAGWYERNGRVTLDEVYESEDGNLYSLKFVGNIVDTQEYKQKIKEKVKGKLSAEELNVLLGDE